MVVAEAIDRLSRDQEHLAHFYKHLMFNGVQLFTLSEGWINELHIGLGGTMGALYVRQLSEKTHRGLLGRVEAGKSGGGITFGYDMVRIPKLTGHSKLENVRSTRRKRKSFERIFEAYANGMAPRKIAFMLNEEGVALDLGVKAGEHRPSMAIRHAVLAF